MHERCERFPFRYFNISIPLSAICTALYWFPFGVSVPPITHRLFRWVQWVSSVTFATSEIHRNHLQVAVAARSSRTNFGFVCNFAIVWGISIEKGGKSGHIWGNQSLDAIIDHINSPLLSALVFIFFFCYLEILKTNATPTLDTQWFGGATIGGSLVWWLNASLAGLAITQNGRRRRQCRQLNCQSFCQPLNCSWQFE